MLKSGLFLTISATLLCPVLFFTFGASLVDINTASLEQLDNLTGIGPALGQRIIDNRPYNSIDDLLKVQGIGPKNLEKIKQQGLAYVNCQGLTTSTSTESVATTTETVKPSPLPIIEKPVNYPTNIFLSEVLPSPEGADTENEFIEIFNANNFEADISDFKIKDKIGAIKTFIIPEGTKIKENSFLTFKSSQTKISLNNTGDGVELLDPSGKIIESTDFGKSQSGQSWSKTPAQSPTDNEADRGWAWTAKPTPSQANAILAISTASASSAQTTSSTKNNLTANIQNYPPQKKNFLAVGIATAIALSSAFIAWRIKKTSTEV